MTVKNWHLRRLSKRLIQVTSFVSGYTDTALRYDDGVIAYDFPGRVPLYVKRAVMRMFQED